MSRQKLHSGQQVALRPHGEAVRGELSGVGQMWWAASPLVRRVPSPQGRHLVKSPGELTGTHCPYLLPPSQASDRLDRDGAALPVSLCHTSCGHAKVLQDTETRVLLCGWLWGHFQIQKQFTLFQGTSEDLACFPVAGHKHPRRSGMHGPCPLHGVVVLIRCLERLVTIAFPRPLF